MTLAPHEIVQDRPAEGLAILFRIISRQSWDELQGWRKALPDSCVEHLMYGLYVLHIAPGGARRLEA